MGIRLIRRDDLVERKWGGKKQRDRNDTSTISINAWNDEDLINDE